MSHRLVTRLAKILETHSPNQVWDALWLAAALDQPKNPEKPADSIPTVAPFSVATPESPQDSERIPIPNPATPKLEPPTAHQPQSGKSSIALKIPKSLERSQVQFVWRRNFQTLRAQTVQHHDEGEIDIDSTANTSAERGILIPIRHPLREQRWSLVLVIEQGDFSSRFPEFIRDFLTSIKFTRPFKQLTELKWHSLDGQLLDVQGRPATSPPCQPLEKWLVFVLSDGLPSDSLFISLQTRLTKLFNPVRVHLVTPLPESLWVQTSLRRVYRAPLAASSSSNILCHAATQEKIFTVTAKASSRYGKMFKPSGSGLKQTAKTEIELLEQFENSASSDSLRLLGLVASLKGFSLDFIKFALNTELFPHLSNADRELVLAEILISGLLSKPPSSDALFRVSGVVHPNYGLDHFRLMTALVNYARTERGKSQHLAAFLDSAKLHDSPELREILAETREVEASPDRRANLILIH